MASSCSPVHPHRGPRRAAIAHMPNFLAQQTPGGTAPPLHRFAIGIPGTRRSGQQAALTRGRGKSQIKKTPNLPTILPTARFPVGRHRELPVGVVPFSLVSALARSGKEALRPFGLPSPDSLGQGWERGRRQRRSAVWSRRLQSARRRRAGK